MEQKKGRNIFALMKVGFVSIFGKPNAGKSTLLNALMGEKLAIVSPKVQTTRHRIKGILTEKDYQVIFSDTPGIIEPRYKLHEKMMQAVKSSLEDADLALLLLDIRDDWEENDRLFEALRLGSPALVVLNKIDGMSVDRIAEARTFFAAKAYCREVVAISALKKDNRPADEVLCRRAHPGEDLFSLWRRDPLPGHRPGTGVQGEIHAHEDQGRYHRAKGDAKGHHPWGRGEDDKGTGVPGPCRHRKVY
jgi:small GTP-binding protein